MAFIPIDSNTIKVGDPITSDLFSIFKDNFDDINTRLSQIETSGATTYVINGDVAFYGYDPLDASIFYYKIKNTFSVSDFRVQLFTKQGITSGSLSLDLQKSNDTNENNFTSILIMPISFDFSVDINYAEKSANIDSTKNDMVIGQVLRIKVLSLPQGFTGKILVSISG
jgi:hypothetical protein